MALDKDKADRLKGSAPSSFLLIRKPVNNVKETDIDGIIFYLKPKYSADDRYPIPFVEHYPSQKDVPSFENLPERLKAIYYRTLKNKTVYREWLLFAGKAFRRNKFMKGKNLPQQFDDWIYRDFGIGKQTIYNYRNFFKLMSVAPKLLGCPVNMAYFVKDHEILMTYFGNEEQIPWKYSFECKCVVCNSYFFGMEF